MPTISEMNKAIENVPQASEAVSGLKAGFTEKDGVLYGPNGTMIARTGKAEKPAAAKSPTATKKEKKVTTTVTKAATKKAATKPAPKAEAKSKAAEGESRRTVNGTDKSVGERRLAVVIALRKMGATSEKAARTADELAAKTGLSRFDVYGQLYHTHKLQKEGFARQCEVEGVRGLSYYLTAKGAKATDDQIKA